MLVEALVYARARFSGQGNPHGHLTEQVGLWARHRRQRAAWAEHLDKARGLCLRAANACPEHARRTALVLGAGLLLDVPLAELSALFGRVVLADMAFLPEVRAQARNFCNVECRETDLTGCLDLLPGLAAQAPPLPSAPLPDLTLGLADLDFVCSANLLSQLPLLALTALRKRAPSLEAETLRGFAASLVRAHLEALRRLPCPACLVTDVTERGLADGRLTYETGLLFGVEPDLPGDTWLWRMAPGGEAAPGLDVERLVLGAPDVHAGRKGGEA